MIILELFFELLFVILDPELQEQIQLEVEKRHIESAVLLGAPTRVEILTDFIKLGVVDFIAISHLHGDHFGGLPFFFLESLYQEPRSRPLILTGPPNLKKRVEMLHLAMFGELAERPMTFPVEYRELPPDQTTRVCGVDLVPFAVPHLEKEICFGYQAKLGDKALLYSGDCGWNEDLVRYSQGTDLFICECCYFGSQTPFHLSYPELRQERERLDCKRLLLSHLGREVLARQEEVSFECAHDGYVVKVWRVTSQLLLASQAQPCTALTFDLKRLLFSRLSCSTLTEAASNRSSHIPAQRPTGASH